VDSINSSLAEYRKILDKHRAAMARCEAQARGIAAQINATMGAIQALERLAAEDTKSSDAPSDADTQ